MQYKILYKKSLLLLANIVSDDKGTTAIEYGIIALLISIVAIASMLAIGNSVSTTFSTVGSGLAAGR
jgi:pilus assembly protein Flp/PilA